MKTKACFAIVICGLLAGGCATGPGSKPDAVPPKLVVGDKGNIWDRPGAFGPVPANLKARGDNICRSVGIKGGAVGFHPQAQNVNGKPFDGGGFLCAES